MVHNSIHSQSFAIHTRFYRAILYLRWQYYLAHLRAAGWRLEHRQHRNCNGEQCEWNSDRCGCRCGPDYLYFIYRLCIVCAGYSNAGACTDNRHRGYLHGHEHNVGQHHSRRCLEQQLARYSHGRECKRCGERYSHRDFFYQLYIAHGLRCYQISYHKYVAHCGVGIIFYMCRCQHYAV